LLVPILPAQRARQKLAAAKLSIPWDEVIRDLSSVRAATVKLGGERSWCERR
jgi:hypothetical protein